MKEFNPTEAMKMVDDTVKEAHKSMVFKVLRAVVLYSPVDTGTYKANHKVNDSGYKKLTNTEGNNSSLAKAIAENEGQAQIAKIKTGYQSSTVSNELPYAGVIEDGHSSQAALGVYRRAVQTVRNSK